MSNSKLVSYTKLSPNCTKPRAGAIKGVAIHCMAGNLTVEGCGNVFQSRKASSHYGIGSDGRIAQYVDERNRAWCTSHVIDHNLVTIEVANTSARHPWPVSGAAYKSLVNLLVDICQRNGIQRLLWQGNKALMGQWGKQNMVVHRWTAAKACPGDYLYNLHGEIAKEVNARLAALALPPTTGSNHKEEKEIMDQKTFNDMFITAMTAMRADLQDNDASAYSEEAREWAKESGIVTGTSASDFNGAWEDFLTREQMVTMLYRFAKLMDKA